MYCLAGKEPRSGTSFSIKYISQQYICLSNLEVKSTADVDDVVPHGLAPGVSKRDLRGINQLDIKRLIKLQRPQNQLA